MSLETSPSNPYNVQAYRKLSGYLLKRDGFGLEGGCPSDGYYFRDGPMTVSDYLTMNSSNPLHAAADLQGRKDALRTREAVIDAQVEDGPTVALLRPATLDRRKMWTQMLEAVHGLDMRRTDIVMFDTRHGLVEEPENHEIAVYVDCLPDPDN
jgi:hypothetical protein